MLRVSDGKDYACLTAGNCRNLPHFLRSGGNISPHLLSWTWCQMGWTNSNLFSPHLEIRRERDTEWMNLKTLKALSRETRDSSYHLLISQRPPPEPADKVSVKNSLKTGLIGLALRTFNNGVIDNCSAGMDPGFPASAWCIRIFVLNILPGVTLIRENKWYCITYVYWKILDIVSRTASTHTMYYKDAHFKS